MADKFRFLCLYTADEFPLLFAVLLMLSGEFALQKHLR